jgi:octaprenyl-diphosphate synthase
MEPGIFLKNMEGHFSRINRALEENLSSHIGHISEVNRYTLLSGGKRIRPLLFILCAGAYREPGDAEYLLSTIFEYLHGATLLHDDVIDHADTRRGRKSANALWGNASSVLVGDFLLSKSFSLAVEGKNLRLLEVLSDTTTQMAEGMVLELLHTANQEIPEEIYRDIIGKKTAVLIAAACKNGAVWAGAPAREESALAGYGLNLGMAFQIVDDLLDYTATQAQFGKPVGKDLVEGKITLPFIHALRECQGADRKRMLELAVGVREGKVPFEEVLTLVETYGGLDYTAAKAKDYQDRALTHLEELSRPLLKEELSLVAEFVIHRKW